MTQTGRRMIHGIDVTVYCTAVGFSDRPARYKVAAEWLGGDVTELKTYGFADDDCLFEVYRQARQVLLHTATSENERIGALEILKLEPNVPDSQLERLSELRQRMEDRWNAEFGR